MSTEGLKRRKASERKEMEKRLEEDLSISSTSSSRIPVFVFPSQMVFNATDRDHLRQLLTIYNPYDFPVRFKVLSTTPSNYTVVDPEGCISSKNSVDLIVRLTTSVPTEGSTPIEDKFRVQLYDYNSSRHPLGRKDVPSIIHFGSLAGTSIIEGLCEGNLPEITSPSDAFQQLHLMAGAGKGRPGVNIAGGALILVQYNFTKTCHIPKDFSVKIQELRNSETESPFHSKRSRVKPNEALKAPKMSQELKGSPYLEFKIHREDESDSYKPNAPSAIKKLAELPRRETLGPEDEAMLQLIGSEMDQTMSLDEPWSSQNIQARLRSGGNEDSFVIRGEGDRSARYSNNPMRSFQEDSNNAADVSSKKESLTQSAIAIRVAHGATRWRKKTSHSLEDVYWRPTDVSRANLKLRAALQTRAAYSDLATVAEDEDMIKVDEHILDSDDEDVTANDKKQYWNTIFDPEETMTRAEKQVEKELMRRKKLTAEERRMKKEAAKQDKKTNKPKRCFNFFQHVSKKGQEHLFVSKHGKRMKKRKLLAKGYFRDDARLFHKACGTFRKTPKRLERTYRCDDTFHNYCVALVSWTWFKALIMVIICVNAIVLAIETWEPYGRDNAFAFEIVDHVFVAIYTIEFLIKIYAHPYRYWRSGFNIFDFIILMISLGKSVIDWTNLADVDSLRALLIVRALRVLRGISFSVQLQVLVSALVETIKTHVLSVVILLVLLLYVTAIIAFYFFGQEYPEAFGTIGSGMLNMLRVLTIDGWTDLNEEMSQRAGYRGTLFIITCIVLGNFLFSNIFVAIIIMNISEATDTFRDKQREQRDTVVRLKKEKVFRRQKLDLRQLFARQRTSAFTDFFSIGGQFQKLLRHDDLVAMADVVTSPLWIDSVYQSTTKANQTSNILMNLHREMADNMQEILQLYGQDRVVYEPITRQRYNRYLKMKAKLALLKKEILRTRGNTGDTPYKVKY
ncbi:unnamed protein product [Allacma fusca]|uniref:MSP domain-containing protein n=1 Tax=Allacma fusca TaxID=39272 RepID=A0A8J2PH15_9HEXA|nr:unnamed protein product [Allacma fusca]